MLAVVKLEKGKKNIFNNNNILEFSIFRKPTQTDHDDSNHHSQHKMAAFRCYYSMLFPA